MCVSSRERVSPKLRSRVNSHHPSSMAENNQRGQETAREYAPIHCIHPCIMKGCFGAARGALGSILIPPQRYPTQQFSSKGNSSEGIKKTTKNPPQAASTASKSLRTILGEVGIFRQEGVRLLDALLDCRWESHDDWCLYVCGWLLHVLCMKATVAAAAISCCSVGRLPSPGAHLVASQKFVSFTFF